MKKSLIIPLFFLVLSTNHLIAENLRGNLQGTLFIDDSGSVVNFGIEDFIGIYPPDEQNLLKAVELEISFPRELTNYRNSVGLYVFKNVSPAPRTGVFSYRGTQVFMRILPVADKIFLEIPFIENHGIQPDVYTMVVPSPVPEMEFPIIISIIPIAKALPNSIYDLEFGIKAKPLFQNKGILEIVIEAIPDDINPEYFLDDQKIVINPSIIVDSGYHTLRIQAPGMDTQTYNFVLQPGQHEVITPEFSQSLSFLKITAPPDASITINGNAVSFPDYTDYQQLEPGIYTIRCNLYNSSIERVVEVLSGEKISINFYLEASIEKSSPY